MSNYYISSDYAGLSCNHVQFYYGYEETEGEDWCFTAKDGEKLLMKVPVTDLDVDDQWDCAECLSVGIGRYIDLIGKP